MSPSDIIVLAETPVEVWVAIIAAIGVAALAFVVGVMQAAFQLWMNYKASVKVEAVRVELEKTTKSNDEARKVNEEVAKDNAAKLEEIKLVTDETKVVTAKTLVETNHNYQKMVERSAKDQEALAAANEELRKSNKEIADLVKTLALSVQARSQGSGPQEETGMPGEHGKTVQVESLELTLKKDEEEPDKVIIESLDMSLESKPESKNSDSKSDDSNSK